MKAKRLAVVAAICAALSHVPSSADPALVCARTETVVTTTTSVSVSDAGTCEVDPLLTKSSAAPVFESGPGNDTEVNRLAQVNIMDFNLSSDGSKLRMVVKTQAPWPLLDPLNPAAFVRGIPAPYTGMRIALLFKSSTLGSLKVSGQDNFHWMAYIGMSLPSPSPTGVSCGIGYFDPIGGYTYFMDSKIDLPTNISCSVNPAARTLTLVVPHTVTWTPGPLLGTPRSVKVAESGKAIGDIKVVSMLDHRLPESTEIEYYSDWMPAAGFTMPAVYAFPMASGVPTHACGRYAGQAVSSPFYDGDPCYAALPDPIRGGPSASTLSITA